MNYFGLRDVCNVLFPILRPHARVVNLSSSQAAVKNIPGQCIRERLSSGDLTEQELSKLMDSFVGYELRKVQITKTSYLLLQVMFAEQLKKVLINKKDGPTTATLYLNSQ